MSLTLPQDAEGLRAGDVGAITAAPDESASTMFGNCGNPELSMVWRASRVGCPDRVFRKSPECLSGSSNPRVYPYEIFMDRAQRLNVAWSPFQGEQVAIGVDGALPVQGSAPLP